MAYIYGISERSAWVKHYRKQNRHKLAEKSVEFLHVFLRARCDCESKDSILLLYAGLHTVRLLFKTFMGIQRKREKGREKLMFIIPKTVSSYCVLLSLFRVAFLLPFTFLLKLHSVYCLFLWFSYCNYSQCISITLASASLSALSLSRSRECLSTWSSRLRATQAGFRKFLLSSEGWVLMSSITVKPISVVRLIMKTNQ